MINTPLKNVKLVIFDVDGTLYDQSKLRNKMMMALLQYYIFRPWKYKELLIIYHFRKEREKRAGYEGVNLYNEQFEWCSKKMNIPVSRIKPIIAKWIFEYPGKFLSACMYPGVDETFAILKDKRIDRAIYSDYDADEKLESMNIEAELLISSTDANINAMKPKPKALNYILESFKINDKSTCLFIGDRAELDGECAKQAGIPFLLIDKITANNNFYKTLSKQILNEN